MQIPFFIILNTSHNLSNQIYSFPKDEFTNLSTREKNSNDQRKLTDSRTHSRRTFPRRTVPRRTLPRQTFPRPDKSPTDISPTLASLYNFADDNTLSAFATTVSELIKILESESEVVIDWFKINKMVVNPDKFQAIILDKRKRDHTDEHIIVDNQQIKVVSSVKLLGLQLDDKLNFNLHISNICKSAANQLNA